MSMLADPRKKQKVINLRAKNTAWSNDSSKFGQRMLEKMGWSAGKGLGAKENGIVEHIVAKYKNDEKGLGYKDNNDQWTKHEDDFNKLLANLTNDEKSDPVVLSGVSLEDKSKKSKARVHYHKFTRGKDLSRYSEKDLANIFGKKSLKNEDEELIEECSTEDNVFTVKGSMLDYFKSKYMSKFGKDDIADSLHNESEEYVIQGFSQSNSQENLDNSNPDYKFNLSTTDSKDIKLKKKKKRKNKELIPLTINEENNDNAHNFSSESPITESQKRKHKHGIIADSCEEAHDQNKIDKQLQKNKKRKKLLKNTPDITHENAKTNSSKKKKATK